MKTSDQKSQKDDIILDSQYSSCFKIPILKIPQSKDVSISLNFNEEQKSLQYSYIDISGQTLEKFPTECYPVERCSKCGNLLTIDICCFCVQENLNIMSCENCIMGDDSFIKLSSIYENHYKPITIIGMLESFVNKNESTSNEECVREINKLISQSKNIAFLINSFSKLPNFDIFSAYLNSYLKNLSNYMNSVNNLKMDNIYLFLKNIIVISTCQSNKFLLPIYGQFYLNNIMNMNVSKLHTYVLKALSEGNKNPNLDLVDKTLKENSNDLDLSLLKILFKYNSLNTTILKGNISSLKNQIRIEHLKNDIIKFLEKYDSSYNIILSKKVLERKFINGIIYALFKYNHDKFDKIKESASILNSIKKELENIENFLDGYDKDNNDKICVNLKAKIKKYIESLEEKLQNKAYKKKDNKKKLNERNESQNKNIFTKEEKLILNKYVSSNSEDSYTRIYASKLNYSKDINASKLQAILEFLFFLRDKTIDIIHILNDNAILFFQFLTNNAHEELDEDNDDENNIYYNYINDDNIGLLEMKMEVKFKFSKNHKSENETFFNDLSLKPTKEINCLSALNYIINNENNKDYENELRYIYENVVLPEKKKYKDLISKKNEQPLYNSNLDLEYLENKI